MTNTHYHNFLPKDFDPTDQSKVEAVLTDNDAFVTNLCEAKLTLLEFHAMLHFTGRSRSEVHQECIEKLDEVQDHITRAFNSKWC